MTEQQHAEQVAREAWGIAYGAQGNRIERIAALIVRERADAMERAVSIVAGEIDGAEDGPRGLDSALSRIIRHLRAAAQDGGK